MRDTKQEIVHFWFEETEPHLRFQQSPEFDALVKERYAMTHEMAADGLCNNWADDAEGALALCLLLDQFPRRMYRGTAAAYATDEKALLIAKQAIHKGFDQVLVHEKRFYIYLPFEHSEVMTDQKRNLELFKSMQHENPVAYNVAQKRYAVFEKFGRFPDRNKALGRDSSEEELEYLKTSGGANT